MAIWRKADRFLFTGIGTSFVTKLALTDDGRFGTQKELTGGMIRAIRVRRTAGAGTQTFTVAIWDQNATVAAGARVLIQNDFSGILVVGSADANMDSQSSQEGYETLFVQAPYVSVLADGGSAHGLEVTIEYSDNG